MAFPPPSQLYNWTFRRVVWATLVLVLVALGFYILYRFNQVVFSLFIAIVFGTVIRPIVAWLHRRGLPPIAAVILVYFLLAHHLHRFRFTGISIDCRPKRKDCRIRCRVTTKACVSGWLIIPIN